MVLPSLRRLAGDPGRRQGRRHADRWRHRPRLSSGVAMLLAEVVIAAVVALLVVITLMRSVRIRPQARARDVERLGPYPQTLATWRNFVIPIVDPVEPTNEPRQQAVPF